MRILLVFLHFFVPFCLISLSFNIHVASSYCSVHEQSLLLHLKDNLVFDLAKSRKLIHWNQTDCCQWNGVSCNGGSVVGLDLSEESISGGLDNSSLFDLQYLQNLNLAYNDFGSLIPSKFNKLKDLMFLNFSNAGFEGQIPIEVSQLTKLVILDLSTSDRPLKLENPSIRILVQNLTQIKELYLDGVLVSAVGKEWCEALSSLQSLQILSMSSCNLSGPIDSTLARLQLLSVIRLSQNNLSSMVPEFFGSLSNFTILELSGCELSGVFPKGILQIQTTLKVLDISDNQALHGSLPSFQHDASLHTINLSNTNFSGQLPGDISNLKQLSSVDLSHCQFNGTIPNSFSKLTKLVHLDLSYNYFTGPLPTFNMSRNLRILSLFHNDFTGALPSGYFDGLAHLHYISLGDNSLSGRVPSSLFTLPSLLEARLSNNGFDGTLDEFPTASSILQFIDLSSNNLEGPIPQSLFQLGRLRFLQLSSNKFNGTVRLDTIRVLRNLHTLGLSHNNLSVDTSIGDDHGLSPFPSLRYLLLGSCKLMEFPRFLRNQSQLIALDLSNNQIQGIIPNWVWRFDSLVYLNLSSNFLTFLERPFANVNSTLFIIDLHSNQLSGPIPIVSKYAAHLDYSNNKFSIIPPTLDVNMPFLYVLSLSNNDFHGEIHESFCNLYFLQRLYLSNNSFNGFIPECLTRKSSTLKVLNLAGNMLIGHISDTISSSCNLRFLDLNGNLLSGTIPKSLANCQRLEVLNLGNNLLSDTFPCFLRNIPTLRVLVLRSNKLHGSIGCPQSTGNWEMLHIVDLASNDFTGTLPGSMLQSWVAMMGNEHEGREKYGALYFDMFDNHDSIHHKDLLPLFGNPLVGILLKIAAAEPFSDTACIFSYYVNVEDELGIRYLDSVTVVNKGLQMKFVKILRVFTSLDFSSNHFEGPIPKELMDFRTLNNLNISHNAFSSQIPSSLGNLTQLESLDLSHNSLNGEIPAEITSLSFLAVLNLSYNHFVGKIPTGAQIQSFEADSFIGNDGLCGPPLTKNCMDGGTKGLSPPSKSGRSSSVEWNFLSVELGFTFGLGIFILPILFCKSWRLWYSKHVDELLYKIIPQLDFVHEYRGGKNYRTLRWRP